MKTMYLTAPGALLALATACAPPGVNTVQLGNSVICGPTEVIMPSQAVTSLRAQIGDAAYGRAVCDAVKGVDATGIANPTPLRVTLPTGDVTVRIRQNQR